jgi:hypothetical protein
MQLVNCVKMAFAAAAITMALWGAQVPAWAGEVAVTDEIQVTLNYEKSTEADSGGAGLDVLIGNTGGDRYEEPADELASETEEAVYEPTFTGGVFVATGDF